MTEAEFHNTYLGLSSTLYRIAYYMLESQAEAEDAVQDLYVKLWESREKLDQVQSPKAYCIRMLKNLCLDRIRKVHLLSFPETLPEKAFVYGPDEGIDDKTRLNKVLEAVKALPERQREVLVLRTVEGLSYEEISARTGIKYLTCRVLLSQARSKIRSKA
ncbi:MAG: RNA polymerase sigma factor [Bacteroidales bacterium]|nr:RNA polymerase sigma factor [Bacteroidales bacterium]